MCVGGVGEECFPTQLRDSPNQAHVSERYDF